MASRGGARAVGTDGTDFLHRQQVAARYQQSAEYKTILKWLFVPHILILVFMWLKIGSENMKHYYAWRSAFFERLALPAAFPWEYVWCLSFIPIICAFCAFPRNNLVFIKYHYYGQFCFGVFPCMIGFGQQMYEAIEYYYFGNESTPTFRGTFPMVFIWYIFIAIALQIHAFSMYFSQKLADAWEPMKKRE